jgi:hypothetical protein
VLSDVRLLLRLSCPLLLDRVAPPAAGAATGANGGVCVWRNEDSGGGRAVQCCADHVLDLCAGTATLDPAAAHEQETVVQLVTHVLSKVRRSF